ncbi:PAS domain-containing protein [Spirosoma arcticum]
MDLQTSLSRQEPIQPFPVAAYEITLLTAAQKGAKRREMTFFQQLSATYNWQLSQPQRQRYLSCIQTGYTLILTDQAKMILWTTTNFLSLTGYSPQEVLGQTPKMLQGPATDSLVARQVGDSVRGSQSVKADLLNYRKDGQSYRCRLWIDPLHRGPGQPLHFLGVAVEYKVTERYR